MYSHFTPLPFIQSRLWPPLPAPLSDSALRAILHLQEQAALAQATSVQTNKLEASPASNYRDKYSHLIGTSAAKDAAHTLQANSAYGCGECTWHPGDQ